MSFYHIGFLGSRHLQGTPGRQGYCSLPASAQCPPCTPVSYPLALTMLKVVMQPQVHMCGLLKAGAYAPALAVRQAHVMFVRTALRAQAMRLVSPDACSSHGCTTVWHAIHDGNAYVYRVIKHQMGMVTSGVDIACIISRH